MKKLFASFLLAFLLFATSFAQVNPPALYSPADGTVFSSSVRPELRITQATNAAYYWVQWSTDSTFQTHDDYTMSRSYTALNVSGLKFNTTYYWRVFSITTNFADTSVASEVRSFTTCNAPTLSSPSDGTIYTTIISPLVSCNSVTGAGHYILEWDTVPTFDSPRFRTYSMTGTSVTINGLEFNTRYYWRVAATNSNDSDTSAWSDVWSFTTMNQPTLSSPYNASTSVALSTSLYCNSVSSVGHYIMEWDTVQTFDSPLRGTASSTSRSVNASNLQMGTLYYWHTRITNSNDSDTSAWSDTWHFTTIGGTPTLSSPFNNGTNVALRPTLHWNSVSNINSYEYECDVTPEFNSPEKQTGSIAAGTTSVKLNVLRYNTVYYWRIRVHVGSQVSAWSSVWNFTTIRTVSLVLPYNNSTGYATTLSLYWNDINDGNSYEYQYDTCNTFNSPSLVAGTEPIGTEQTTISGLHAGTTYYWRVRQISDVDTSDWSEVWNFTTQFETIYTEFSAISCDSYTWNNRTYTSSGDYVQTFVAQNQADSVVTLHLTIHQSVSTDFSDSACETYTWNDETYNQSGDYTQTFAAANGCDSIVTLHLTINENVIEEITQTAEGSYEWNGTVYTESGDYTWTGTTAAGCDSTVILHLTITTGIANYSDGKAIKVWPNPAKSVVNVECGIENAEVQLFDMTGRRVLSTAVVGDITAVNVSTLALGIYVLHIVADGKSVGTAKVIVN